MDFGRRCSSEQISEDRYATGVEGTMATIDRCGFELQTRRYRLSTMLMGITINDKLQMRQILGHWWVRIS